MAASSRASNPTTTLPGLDALASLESVLDKTVAPTYGVQLLVMRGEPASAAADRCFEVLPDLGCTATTTHGSCCQSRRGLGACSLRHL